MESSAASLRILLIVGLFVLKAGSDIVRIFLKYTGKYVQLYPEGDKQISTNSLCEGAR